MTSFQTTLNSLTFPVVGAGNIYQYNAMVNSRCFTLIKNTP